jgi:hypothetical protein
MSVLNSLARIAAKPIPKAVTPKVHGIVDYITIGIFFGTVPVFWRRNRRACRPENRSLISELIRIAPIVEISHRTH